MGTLFERHVMQRTAAFGRFLQATHWITAFAFMIYSSTLEYRVHFDNWCLHFKYMCITAHIQWASLRHSARTRDPPSNSKWARPKTSWRFQLYERKSSMVFQSVQILRSRYTNLKREWNLQMRTTRFYDGMMEFCRDIHICVYIMSVTHVTHIPKIDILIFQESTVYIDLAAYDCISDDKSVLKNDGTYYTAGTQLIIGFIWSRFHT
jgi:hypothetical protein